MKLKHVYHGSIRKIRGNKLLPRQAKDLGNNPENLHRAVYATDVKDIAIAMAIISCKGVNEASLKFGKRPFGIVYDGRPKQNFIYLYSLPIKTFKQEGGKGNQYYSLKPVKPVKAEKLSVRNYMDLIRRATKKEKEKWNKKYGIRKRSNANLF